MIRIFGSVILTEKEFQNIKLQEHKEGFEQKEFLDFYTKRFKELTKKKNR